MSGIYLNKAGKPVGLGMLESRLSYVVDTLEGMHLFIEYLWESFDAASIDGELWKGLHLVQAGGQQAIQSIKDGVMPDCAATDEWFSAAKKKGSGK